jgi:hypothetical protein
MLVPAGFLYVVGFVIFMAVAYWLYSIYSRGPVVAKWEALYEGFTNGAVQKVRREGVFYANGSHVVPKVTDVKIGEGPWYPWIVGGAWLQIGGDPIYQEYCLVPETERVNWNVTGVTPHKS